MITEIGVKIQKDITSIGIDNDPKLKKHFLHYCRKRGVKLNVFFNERHNPKCERMGRDAKQLLATRYRLFGWEKMSVALKHVVENWNSTKKQKTIRKTPREFHENYSENLKTLIQKSPSKLASYYSLKGGKVASILSESAKREIFAHEVGELILYRIS